MKRLFVTIAMLLFVALNTNAQETTYAKSDFVPDDEIIFDDNFEMEKLGEFPLRWDLLDGYAETAKQKVRIRLLPTIPPPKVAPRTVEWSL